MQLIVEIPVDAEEYVAQDFHRKVAPPAACPHCHVGASLETLGYYDRNVTGRKSNVLRLSIRRFRCTECGKTVSILPAFAQPYRLVHNHAIHRFFCGQRKGEDIESWLVLLGRYWKRFGWWVSQSDAVLDRRFARAPPPRSARAWWAAVVAEFGSMVVATRTLVTDSQVTLFGKYQCHRPNVPVQ